MRDVQVDLGLIYGVVDRCCQRLGIEHTWMCAEGGLAACLVPRRYDSLTPRLIQFLRKTVVDHGLVFREQRTRSGTILAFAVDSISEEMLAAVTPAADKLRLARRLDMAFAGGLRTEAGLARRPVPESVPEQGPAPEQGSRPESEPESEPESGLGLGGIAVEHQPLDMLRRLRQALADIGLLDTLTVAGITNRLSADKQTLHFFIVDADRRRRPIAAYELSKLGEGNNLEQALKDLRDLANNHAPGTTERLADKVHDEEQALRKVAKKYEPRQPDEEPQMLPVS